MVKKELLFRVNGIPQGKGRPRVSTANGITRAYTPAKTRKYEQEVAEAAKLAAMKQNWMKSDAPIILHICAWFPIPKSWPKWKKAAAQAGDIYPTTKPDADNIGKGISDALNEIVYNDDSQVVECIIKKRYCRIDNEPHVVVFVEPMKPYSVLQEEAMQAVKQEG